MSSIVELFQKIPDLPMMPKVVKSIMDSIEDDDLDLDILIKDINQDPVIFGQTLSLVNSSYYGLSKKVETIEKAVPIIGLSALSNMVMATSLVNAFKEVPGYDMTAYWKRSILTAMIAREFSVRLGLNSQIAYTAGLTHSIGELLIQIAYPDEADDIKRYLNVDGTPVSLSERIRIEKKVLNFDHCIAGVMLVKKWNFPKSIVDALINYAGQVHVVKKGYGSVLTMSANIANAIEMNKSSEEIMLEIDDQVADSLNIDKTTFINDIDGYFRLVSQVNAMLGITPGKKPSLST